MAHERVWAEREHGRHLELQLDRAGMPDGVDAAEETVKPLGLDSVLDRAAGEAARAQLLDRDRAVLARGDGGDRGVAAQVRNRANVPDDPRRGGLSPQTVGNPAAARGAEGVVGFST
jgi:hypothetical protein